MTTKRLHIGTFVHGTSSEVKGRIVEVLNDRTSKRYRDLVAKYEAAYGVTFEDGQREPPFYVVADEGMSDRPFGESNHEIMCDFEVSPL